MLLLGVVEFRCRILSFSGRAVFQNSFCVLLRLQANQERNGLPRRMPCEKDFHVAVTLLLAVVSHLALNQLVNEENEQNERKATIF
jgi:hypothetical protein